MACLVCEGALHRQGRFAFPSEMAFGHPDPIAGRLTDEPCAERHRLERGDESWVCWTGGSSLTHRIQCCARIDLHPAAKKFVRVSGEVEVPASRPFVPTSGGAVPLWGGVVLGTVPKKRGAFPAEPPVTLLCRCCHGVTPLRCCLALVLSGRSPSEPTDPSSARPPFPGHHRPLVRQPGFP